MFSHPDMSEDTDTTNKDLNSNGASDVEEIQQENETIESDVEEIQQENETIESDVEEIQQENETIESDVQLDNKSNDFESNLEENSIDESNNESSDAENLEKMILSTGIRVGTPVKTKSMSRYIVRANPEGLYILDISKTLYRIDIAAKFIGRTNIAKVAVTSAREYGKKPVEKFCEATGATQILGRFMPGTFTNPSLPKYMEPDIVIVTDPQADRQAVIEATRAGVPVIAISNSDNVISQVDLVLPANNRGRKALATVYWLLAREVMKKQGKIKSDKDMKSTIDDFETKLVEEII
jgi:small subunit ribosomal protein S2